jgi:hypothetical protein
MPMWEPVENRREGILESHELSGRTQQALVENADRVGIIVSISILLPQGSTVDDGKSTATRMLIEANRRQK